MPTARNAASAAGEIVFSRIGPSGSGIFVVNADGTSAPARILEGGDTFGRTASGRLLYAIELETGERELWSIRLDGTDARKLVEETAYQYFVVMF